MSVGFDFYQNTYGGSLIPYEEWVNYEAHASAQLARYKDIYTVSSYTSYEGPDAESMAVCAMAETFYSYDSLLSGQGEMKSASIGSVSVSYGGTDIDTSPQAQAKELLKAAKRFLSIYRGA